MYFMWYYTYFISMHFLCCLTLFLCVMVFLCCSLTLYPSESVSMSLMTLWLCLCILVTSDYLHVLWFTDSVSISLWFMARFLYPFVYVSISFRLPISFSLSDSLSDCLWPLSLLTVCLYILLTVYDSISFWLSDAIFFCQNLFSLSFRMSDSFSISFSLSDAIPFCHSSLFILLTVWRYILLSDSCLYILLSIYLYPSDRLTIYLYPSDYASIFFYQTLDSLSFPLLCYSLTADFYFDIVYVLLHCFALLSITLQLSQYMKEKKTKSLTHVRIS